MNEEKTWKERAIEAADILKQLTKPPLQYATLIEVNNDVANITFMDGRSFVVYYDPRLKDDFKQGQTVRVSPETMAVVGIDKEMKNHSYAKVKEVLPDGRVQIDGGGRDKIISSVVKELKVGDNVLTDNGYSLVIEKIENKKSLYELESVPNIPWSKIGGLENIIESIKEAVEEPFQNREVYEKYGLNVPKGILLYGPPGCGKTLLAKAVAYNLSENMQDDITVGFIDEAETLLGRRGSHLGSGHLDDSLVTTFLAEMNGINAGNGKRNLNGKNGGGYFLSVKGPEFKNMWYGESERGIREFFAQGRERSENFLLILATNRAEDLDPAVVGPHRIDRKFRVGRPSRKASIDIMNIHLSGIPVYSNGKKEKINELSNYGCEELSSEKYPLFEVTFNRGDRDYVLMGNLVSGAMIESIANRAKLKAAKREIKKSRIKGLVKKDLVEAVRDEYLQNRSLASFDDEDLKEIYGERYESISEIKRNYGGING
jgi:proteasome-associated ATPase